MQITPKMQHMYSKKLHPLFSDSQLFYLEGCSVSVITPHLYCNRRPLDSSEIRTMVIGVG